MKKIVPLALVASVVMSLGAMTLPAAAAVHATANAATGPATSPYCDATQSYIDDHSADITQRLATEGYSVDSLDASGGCLVAFVHKGSVSEVLRLDPTDLTPVGSLG